MSVVCLCVKTLLIDKFTDGNFPGGSHPHPLHIPLAIYFYFVPMTMASLASKQVVFTFGSDFYDFVFALLTMQILIEHHFKECEKENSLIKMLFMNCLILFLHCNISLREMNADF